MEITIFFEPPMTLATRELEPLAEERRALDSHQQVKVIPLTQCGPAPEHCWGGQEDSLTVS
jgi:hypothetical protein